MAQRDARDRAADGQIFRPSLEEVLASIRKRRQRRKMSAGYSEGIYV